MYKIILLFGLLLNCISCNYLEKSQEVHYYKYNNIPKSGSYYIVYEDNLDSYSNAKYLQIAQQIKESLSNLNLVEASSLNSSDYLLYYSYEVSRVNKNKEYQAILTVKMFNKAEKVAVFNKDSADISQRHKMIFDSNSVMFSRSYNINQSINCLSRAIFKQQSFGNQKSFSVENKINSEKFDISNSSGIYYCL
ncbi:MAG: hypothetical protein LBH40_03735 [Alphaproteobacteria bacterium]|jgi:hypothetical protein|nr:hypothetical protein [Alphaproteobacteria bacterium]